MDHSLWDALGEVADRRGRQGRHYPLRSVLGISLGAILAGANAITAAPSLLNGLSLEGALVPGDAIFAQRQICRPIRDGQGNYLFAVKDNQPERRRTLAIAFGDESPPL